MRRTAHRGWIERDDLRVTSRSRRAACRVRYPNGDEVEYVVTVFECEVRGGELIASNDETKTLAYFRREDMPALELSYPRAIFDDGRPTAFFA